MLVYGKVHDMIVVGIGVTGLTNYNQRVWNLQHQEWKLKKAQL
jgi:hypothetical protein